MTGWTHEGAIRREIEVLHVVFERWLSATALDAPADLEAVERALHPRFAMTTPGGVLVDKAGVMSALGAGRASRGIAADPFRIWITQVQVCDVSADRAVARYVENQRMPGTDTARRALVVFAPDPGRETGLSWLALSETWTTP